MKKRNAYVTTTFTVISALILLLFIMYASEDQKNKISSYEELKMSGLIEAGWLPHFLPKSSSNIIERHNIDTNVVEASFQYLPADIKSVETECQNKTFLQNGVEFKCRHNRNYISIKLFNNGEGYLVSSPFIENI